jgi:hypothetical protein
MKIRIIIALLILATLSGKTLAQSKKDTLPSFIGISYIPELKWRIMAMENAFPSFMRDKDKERPMYLKYNFNMSSQSSIEGNFGIKSIGLRIGLSANIENNLIGKAYKYGGYIGYKNIWLKLSRSKLEGDANWTKTSDIGYLSPFKFSNDYFNIELIKNSNLYKYMAGGAPSNITLGTHWGVGYNTFAIPIEFETLTTPGGREHQVFGKPAFDKNYKAKFYTAGFGWDMLRQLCLTGGKYGSMPGKPAMRFALYASTQDKVGFGSGEISDGAVLMAEAVNPGKTIVKNKGFVFMVNFSLSVGVRYYHAIGPVFMVGAIGFDFEAIQINGGPGADTDIDLGYEYDPLIINRGVSFKLYLSWIKKK